MKVSNKVILSNTEQISFLNVDGVIVYLSIFLIIDIDLVLLN